MEKESNTGSPLNHPGHPYISSGRLYFPPSPSQPVITSPVPESTLPVTSPAITGALPRHIRGTWVLTTMATDKDTPAGIR
jgi:hypothetical protein